MFPKFRVLALWIFRGRVLTRDVLAHPKPETMSRRRVTWPVALVKDFIQHLQVLLDKESSAAKSAIRSATSGEAKDLPQHCQVLPDEESSAKSGSATSGEAKDFSLQVLPDEESSAKSGSATSSEAKDFSLQVLPDEESSGPGSGKSGSATSGEANCKDFRQHFQILPDKESSVKSGSATSGNVSVFNALFQAPSGIQIQPQWQEVDEIYHRMRGILHSNPKYMDGERLFHEDEIAVRDILKYHPNIANRRPIQRIFNRLTRCFWVVRVDGTEIDFSYHKCLKEKAAKECPDLLERYDFLYKFYKPRPAHNPTS